MLAGLGATSKITWTWHHQENSFSLDLYQLEFHPLAPMTVVFLDASMSDDSFGVFCRKKVDKERSHVVYVVACSPVSFDQEAPPKINKGFNLVAETVIC